MKYKSVIRLFSVLLICLFLFIIGLPIIETDDSEIVPAGSKTYRQELQEKPVRTRKPPELHIAIRNRDLTTVRHLLQAGADIEQRMYNDEHLYYYGGYTPLMYAVELGFPEIVDYLISSGANIHAKSTLPYIDYEGKEHNDKYISVIELAKKHPDCYNIILNAIESRSRENKHMR